MIEIKQHISDDIIFTGHLAGLESLTQGMIEYQWLANEFAKQCPIDKWNEICNRFEANFGTKPIVYRPWGVAPTKIEISVDKDSD